MPADTYDPILGLILQGTGNNNNAWGLTLNNSMIKLAARATAGMATQAVTGGTLDLSGSPPPASARQDLDLIQNITGVLTSAQIIIVPNISKTWIFFNNTTGAFHTYVKTSSGTAVQVPQGTCKTLVGFGSNVIKRLDEEEIGALRISGKSGTGPGELACNGASYLRTDLPDLFGKIGTTWGAADGTHFNVPDFITNNRFLRAAGGALAVGTVQTSANLAHSHAVSGAPVVGTLTTDSQGSHFHSAGVSDPTHGHGHNAPAQGSGGGITGGGAFLVNQQATAATISAASTGLRASSSNGLDTTYTAGAHTHTVTGTLAIGTLATVADGTTESRPNNAAVLICIRF